MSATIFSGWELLPGSGRYAAIADLLCLLGIGCVALSAFANGREKVGEAGHPERFPFRAG